MARRTVVEESGPGYVEDDSGPVLGMIVGLLIAAAVVVLAVLFFTGTFDNDNDGSPSSPGNPPASSQPSEPSDQESAEPQPSSTP